MQTTENIGLKKPGENDFYSIDDSNKNMDIIDEEVRKLKTAESQVPVLPETPSERTNIADGDNMGTILAKIVKWFSDLKAAAFAGIANNCTTTASGSVLDARQGKVLQDQITEQSNNLKGSVTSSATAIWVNSSPFANADERSRVHGFMTDAGLPTLRFAHYLAGETAANDESLFRFDGTNFYAIGKLGGADTVTKKLGSGTLKKVSLGTGTGKSNYDGATVTNTFTIPDYIPLDNCQVLAVANGAGGSHTNDGDDESYSMSLTTTISNRTVTVTCTHSHGHSNRQTLYLNYTVYAIYIE